jgi:pimeloyl-ACP methyl ester carboxylesterase
LVSISLFLSISPIQEFRQEKQINNFVLAGHSLGGYLSARYAMKYPHQGMKALILISPAGLADHPPLEHQIPTSELSTPIRLLDVMWSSNFTPQQIVRFLGPKGPNTVRNAVSRRFGADRWKESDSNLVADYLYHISAAPASGEYAMNSILKPIVSKGIQRGKEGREGKEEGKDYQSTSVYAREPISPKVFYQALTQSSSPTRSPSSSSPPPLPPPVLLLYGDHDWLRFPKMDQYIRDLRSYEVRADLVTVPSAGHHLYLDNTAAFHEKINQWLDSVNVE